MAQVLADLEAGRNCLRSTNLLFAPGNPSNDGIDAKTCSDWQAAAAGDTQQAVIYRSTGLF